MQMTGQQRIPAPRQRVWDALFDPEILKQCIPGCQSLTQESSERMRAVAEIKIGPIGARFNATVTLSSRDPPSTYTMGIEAQGGTIGSVKGTTHVRLADDGAAGTLLSYDVDAQIGGRLAQLGGPIIDATAKQLAAKFFQQFGSLLTPTTAANASSLSVATPVASAPAATPMRATDSSRDLPVAWLLAIIVAALVGYLIGHAHGGESDWMGLAIGLLLLVVAATGFELGRRTATPVVVLDAALLARLSKDTPS